MPTESEERSAESLEYDSLLREIAHVPSASPEPDVTSLPEGGVGPNDGRGGLDRLRMLEQEELSVAIARSRRGMGLGLLVWFSFFGADVLVNSVFQLHHLGTFVVLRLVVLPTFVGERMWLARRPSLRALRAWEVLRYTLGAGLIAVMCTFFHGFASPYAPGICLILAHRVMITTDHPRRALLMNAAPALALPVVLFVGCAFSPVLRAQLHDPRAMTTFAINMAFIQGTAVMMVITSHILWSLRQQLFEAKSVGRYKLKRRIGGGGMGEVWVAYHAALKRDVAIKILRPDVRDRSPQAVVRFEREVRATTELRHPNTVRILDYGTTPEGLWYYAMELLDGETLDALVRREGPLPAARATRLAFQAARALGEAHARGIVHRDVKPENLFVTELGGEKDFVKVLDFGIAKLMNHEADATATHAGSILGTPAYMSPEVASGQPASARSDVYGLGAVIYFVLCGHPPFEAASVGEHLYSHVHRQPLPPSARLGREIPRQLEALVLACLAKDPAARAASGSELATLLSALELDDDEPGGRGPGSWRSAASTPKGSASTILQVSAAPGQSEPESA